MTRLSCLIPTLVLLVASALVHGLDGDLDTTFASGSGVLRLPWYIDTTRYTTAASSLAIRTDGGIVVDWVYAPCCAVGNLYRTLADGSALDASFGGAGVSSVQNGGSYGNTARMKVDASGRIVVGGNCSSMMGDFGHPCLWRINADGYADLAFGANSVVVLPATTYDTAPFDVVVDFDFDVDGTIYAIVDPYQAALPYAFATLGVLFKVDSAGNVVGSAAPIAAPSGFTAGLLRRIVVRDGKLTIGGFAYVFNSSKGIDIVVLRFDTNGSIDNGFGSGGVASFGFDIGGTNKDDLGAMLIQPDGKILLGGTATDEGSTPLVEMGLARMKSDGSSLEAGDPGFGSSTGSVTFTAYYDGNTGDRSQDTLTDIALQSDFKIVVAGWSDRSHVSGANPNADNVSSAVFRFDPFGYPDAGFANGTLNLALGFMSDAARVDHVAAIGLQGGRIVLAGYAGAGVDANDLDVVVARLQSDLIFTNGLELGPAPPPL